jgi:hypothetical protein
VTDLTEPPVLAAEYAPAPLPRRVKTLESAGVAAFNVEVITGSIIGLAATEVNAECTPGGDECVLPLVVSVFFGAPILVVTDVTVFSASVGEALALRKAGVHVSLVPAELAVGCLVIAAAGLAFPDEPAIAATALGGHMVLGGVQLAFDAHARARHLRGER